MLNDKYTCQQNNPSNSECSAQEHYPCPVEVVRPEPRGRTEVTQDSSQKV